MPFDPKAYLQKRGVSTAAPDAAGEPPAPAPGGFDAKAYLAKKNGLPPAAAEVSDEPTVLQEMHPDFSVVDRLVVKNLASTPAEAVEYLEKKHPNLEIKNVDGEIRARTKAKGKSDEPYRVLDPGDMKSTGSVGSDLWRGAKEGVMDLTDLASDALVGAGTTAASAAGGLGGAALGSLVGPAGTVAGAVGGAATAGGAAGVGLEGAKQALARALGVGHGVDTTGLAVSGAAGALAPMLMGTGATAAQAARAGVSAASQRGLLGVARDGLAPLGYKLGEKLSGISRDAIRGLSDNLPEILRAEKDPMGLTKMVHGTWDKIKDTLTSAKQKDWATYQDELRQALPVDATEARQALETAIGVAEQKAKSLKGNEASQELVDQLKAAHERYFMGEESQAVTKMVPSPSGMVDANGKPVMVSQTTQQMVPKPIGTLDAPAAADLERQLAEGANFSAIKPGSITARHEPGASLADRGTDEALADAKKQLQESLEQNLSPQGIAAKENYGRTANTQRDLKARFNGDAKTAQTFRNLSSSENQILAEGLGDVDRRFGTDILPDARKAQAAQVFARPGWLPVSSRGGSGWARAGVGAGAGAAAGEFLDHRVLHGSGHSAAAGGAAVGAALTSPTALRAYIRALAAGKDSVLTAAGARAAAAPLWNMMQPEKKDAP